MADIETYQERIRKNTDKLRDEQNSRKKALLSKQILRDRINIEIQQLKMNLSNS